VYFPVIVPKSDESECSSSSSSSSCWIRVNHEKKFLSEGNCLVFDDSFLHEAANESLTEPRLVLLVDIWHPDLSEEEIKVLEFINKGQILATKRLAAQLKQESDANNNSNSEPVNFFTAIQSSNEKGIDEREVKDIWGK
jgi:aspartyl/asparaginyl beta-hydroxylase (cupin superfamily)